jgi:glycosyltransferase involved in cell wall biosynthesis
MTSKLISFCIPTYNRPDELMLTISSIINQGEICDYEIVISDNSENDETAKFMESFRNNPKIRYYRNSTNIGSAANFVKVISLAKGKYVWLMSDDDCLCAGALSRITNLLSREPNLVYVFAARLLCDSDLNTIAGTLQPEGVYKDVIYKTGKDLFSGFNGQMAMLIGFISSTIIRKDIWDESCKLVGEPLGNWSHARVILHAIKDKPCAVLAGENVLAIKSPTDDVIRSDIWLDQGVELMILAGQWGYDSQLCRRLTAYCFYHYAKMFVIDKALGRRSGNLYSLAKRLECKNYIRINWIWFIISLFPISVLSPLPWINKKGKLIANYVYRK